MKQAPTALLLLIIAFTNYYFLPYQSEAPPNVMPAPGKPAQPKQPPSKGSAPGIERVLNEIFGQEKKSQPDGTTTTEDRVSLDSPQCCDQAHNYNIRFLIATVSDPDTTNLGLFFDRIVEGIQEAAADSGYTFDNAHSLPWHSPLDALPSQFPLSLKTDSDGSQTIDKKTSEDADEEPGLLVFRRHGSVERVTGHAPREDFLMILLVGETPTMGINRKQFETALNIIRRTETEDARVGILGPNFSGSFASLARELVPGRVSAATACPQGSKPADTFFLVRSSSTMSDDEIGWFRNKLCENGNFLSFTESARASDAALLSYLEAQGTPQNKVAILSEDETPYGAAADPQQATLAQVLAREGPVTLYFPRGISMLRTAYQEDTSLVADPANARAPRTTLPPDLSSSGHDRDTVPAFTKQVAYSQEAVMQEVVRTLRDHRSKFILLRATDSMDLLFLASYLRKHYTDGRLIFMGADILERRDVDDALLRGIMSLTQYPLITKTEEGHGAHHRHRIFAATEQVGEYNAGMDLLKELDNPETSVISNPKAIPGGVEYAEYEMARVRTNVERPWLWLTALGRDGFVPIAAFPPCDRPKDCQKTIDGHNLGKELIDAAPPPVLSAPLKNELRNADRTPKSLFALALLAFPKISLLNVVVVVLLLALSAYFVFYSGWGKAFALGPGQIMGPLLDRRRGVLLVAGASILLVMWLLILPELRWVWIPWLALISSLWWASYRHDGKLGAWALASAIATCAAAAGAYWVVMEQLNPWEKEMLLRRARNIPSGLSPTLPFLLLFAAALWWILYQLRIRSSDLRRSRLPRGDGLFALPSEDRFGGAGESRTFLKSCEFLLILVTTAAACFLIFESGFYSLEGRKIDHLFFAAFLLSIAVLLNTLAAAWIYWQRCKQLLSAIDRSSLRYAIQAIRGFSWRRVWGLGNSESAFAFRPVTRAIEALGRLQQQLPPGYGQTPQPVEASIEKVQEVRSQLIKLVMPHPLDEAQPAQSTSQRFASRLTFNQSFSEGVEALQSRIAASAVLVYNSVLKDYWQSDKRFVTRDPDAPTNTSKNRGSDSSDPDRVPTSVPWGEEFVSLVYVGFVLQVLLKIRWLGIAAAGMFVFLLLSVTLYPFEPAGTIHAFFVFVFLGILAVFGIIYGQMHRDDTLSHLTDTTPGELGGDYWLRMLGVAGFPLFTLISAQVPQLSRTLFFWVKPLLDGLSKKG